MNKKLYPMGKLLLSLLSLSLLLSACGETPADDEGEVPLLTSLEELEGYLAGKTATKESPLKIKLNLDLSNEDEDFVSILPLLTTYVALDLSDCTGAARNIVQAPKGDVIPGQNPGRYEDFLFVNSVAKSYVVSLILPDIITVIKDGTAISSIPTIGNGLSEEYQHPGTFTGATFADYKNLAYIAGANVHHIGGYAFSSSIGMETNTCPLVEVSFPKARSIGWNAFQGSPESSPNAESFLSYAQFKHVEFPEVLVVGRGAFSDCRKLESVSFPKLTAVESGTFSRAFSLETVYMPEVRSIGDQSFPYTKIKSIDLRKVTSIGFQVFRSCYDLESIYLGATPPTIGDIIFMNNGLQGGKTISFYVPSLAQYNESPWSDKIGDYNAWANWIPDTVNHPNDCAPGRNGQWGYGYWWDSGINSIMNLTVALEVGSP